MVHLDNGPSVASILQGADVGRVCMAPSLVLEMATHTWVTLE